MTRSANSLAAHRFPRVAAHAMRGNFSRASGLWARPLGELHSELFGSATPGGSIDRLINAGGLGSYAEVTREMGSGGPSLLSVTSDTSLSGPTDL